MRGARQRARLDATGRATELESDGSAGDRRLPARTRDPERLFRWSGRSEDEPLNAYERALVAASFVVAAVRRRCQSLAAGRPAPSLGFDRLFGLVFLDEFVFRKARRSPWAERHAARRSAPAAPATSSCGELAPGARLDAVERQSRVFAPVQARAPDGRRPRTCASPGACGPRGASSSRRTVRAGGRRPGAVGPSSSSTPSREPADRLVVGLALHLGLVDLVHLVARVGSRCASGPSFVRRSAPVVSASRRPTGTTRRSCADEIDDRRAAVRVAGGRDHAGGLVQEDVRERLGTSGRPSSSTRSPRLDERARGPPSSPLTRTRPALISSSAPAARGDAGPRDVGVQPHGAHCALPGAGVGWADPPREEGP